MGQLVMSIQTFRIEAEILAFLCEVREFQKKPNWEARQGKDYRIGGRYPYCSSVSKFGTYLIL